MRKVTLILVCYLTATITKAQTVYVPYEPFHDLDSIGNSNSYSKYFGRLYYDFLYRIETQLNNRDSSAQKLVRRFEKVFADFYINACKSNCNNEKIDLKEWEAYFADSSLIPIQYILLGTNAHLNGGLWNALVKSFSAEEMDQLKPEFKIFKRSLNTTYRVVYNMGRDYKKLEKIRHLTIGLDKPIGNYYLYKWRKRQMRIARLYWNHSPKFERLAMKVERKKQKIDHMILSNL